MTKAEQVYTTYIRTTPEKLWNALTNPEFTMQYWGGINLSDWKKGSKWQHLVGKEKTLRIVGEVLEIVPPKRLVLSWVGPGDKSTEAHPSRVIFEIEQLTDVVRLNVTHDNLESGSEMYLGISRGWPLVLSSLKSFMETGQPLDIWALKSCNAPEAA